MLPRAADLDELFAHSANFSSKRKITLRHAAQNAKPRAKKFIRFGRRGTENTEGENFFPRPTPLGG
jgi:hypothetical protein